MTYDPKEISDTIERVDNYLGEIDYAIAADINQGKKIIEEHSANLEQIAEMGRYALSMITNYLDFERGTIPRELPTPRDNPQHREEYAKKARELYEALVSEKNVWELLPEDKRDKERVGLITTRIKELDEYLFASAVLDATFG